MRYFAIIQTYESYVNRTSSVFNFFYTINRITVHVDRNIHWLTRGIFVCHPLPKISSFRNCFSNFGRVELALIGRTSM